MKKGYCKCGCGQLTPISKRNRFNLGHIKDQPIDYLKSHKLRGKKRPPFSDEWKKKISISHVGKIPWNKDKQWDEEVLEKLRCPRDSMIGANNPNWKGGIDIEIRGLRRSREYRVWKQAIRKRDKVCVWCSSSKQLHADHIKSFTYYPDFRYDINNGRLLCFECHRKTPNYGRKAIEEVVLGL